MVRTASRLLEAGEMLAMRKVLPKRQRVADQLGAGGKSWIEWTSQAKDRKYISLNEPVTHDTPLGKVEWIIRDVDHDGYDSFPGSLPKPVCTTISRCTGRHHHVWKLKTPVLIGDGVRRKPLALLAAVEAGLTYHLDADPSYTNTLTKNPWNTEAWSVIWWPDAKPVDLMDFGPWLLPLGTITTAPNAAGKVESCGYSRNVDLFDHTRRWAYRHWDGDREAVYGVAHAFNERLAAPLPPNEVDATAKSICKFMEQRYTGTPKPSITRERNRQTKVDAILAAESSIRATGQRPTNDLIAAVTGIPRRTVSHILSTL